MVLYLSAFACFAPLREIISAAEKNRTFGVDMFLHVKEAEYLHDYVIRLKFNDGAEGEADLRGELYGSAFASLQDLNQFKKFSVDPELETGGIYDSIT
jgi:hypothetical protein